LDVFVRTIAQVSQDQGHGLGPAPEEDQVENTHLPDLDPGRDQGPVLPVLTNPGQDHSPEDLAILEAVQLQVWRLAGVQLGIVVE